jgi:PAS domain S-box-containing protein
MKKTDIFDKNAPPLVDAGFLDGSSKVAALIRSLDWSNTPLGPIENWPQSLRTTVNLCLASNFAICIIWGPGHTQIYNDAYRIICGAKHPVAMGMAFPECWKLAWPAIGKSFEDALEGVTSFLENQRIFLHRNGYLEETFFTFSLSPIRDESNSIGGLFHPVTETTETMVGERRTRAVINLTARLGDVEVTSDVFQRTSEALAMFDLDIPFALLYRFDKEAQLYRLAGCTGIETDTCLSPAVLSLDGNAVWPMEHLLRQVVPAEVSGLRALIGSAPAATPCGPYEEAPDVAFAVPIRQPGIDMPVALFIAGASPRAPLNDVYRGFYDLLAAAFRAALGRATVAEVERKRLEMLASIDRAKTVFFSNVSHEFRTPLTLMLGPLEDALAAQDLSAAQQERMQIAHRNAERLLTLVNSLLDFSRIEAGRNDGCFAPTDLSALTLDLASSFQSACMQAGLAFTVECASLHEPVYVDSQMWEKIVLNLLSNAFKYTLQGGIGVALREIATGVELEVSDTGVGIPAAELPKIFERFHRVEAQRGRSMEGTGIGLSLVKELTHLHGGTITAESIVGQGSIFKVSIPFGKDHLPVEQVREQSAAPERPDRARSHVEEALRWLPAAESVAERSPTTAIRQPKDKPRIVLADDNADKLAYIRRILEEGGYQVDAVGNGTAALAAIRNGTPPELVLSDVMMPEMDGFSLLHTLRSDDATKELTVILLSARAGEEARMEGLAAGADDYLVKPFSARELRARIDGLIGLSRQRRESAAREQALLLQVEAERGRAALHESEAHVASLFEQTAAGIAESDLAGHLVRVNDRYCKLVGRRRDELIGQRIDALVHPEELATYRALLENMARTGKPFEVDSRCQRPDGETVWVSKTVTPIFNSKSENVESVLAVVLDITDRKKAEAKFEETAGRLQFTLDAAQIGDWDLDLVDNKIYHSLRHDLCFGYTEPIANWSFEKFIEHAHADDRDFVRQQFQTALAESKDWHFECRVLWPDQGIHWIAAHGSVHHTNAKPTGMGGIVVDITKRKLAEEELRETSRRKDEFLAMLAHELRNPLAPISAAAELIAMVRLDEARLKQTSAVISRQVRHMTSLVDDLLDVSRVSRGLVTINPSPHAVKSIVAIAVEQVQPVLQARRHRLVIDLAPESGHVLADQKRLVQVLTNLLNNAAKYTPEGGRIALRTEVHQKQILLIVQDNGIGIAPALQARVFDLFAQAERTSDRTLGGLGLGLALVKSLVDLHGGKVSCFSEGLGKGSVFTVTLPHFMAQNDATDRQQKGGITQPAGKKLRILIVDDNVDAAQMLALLLQASGHEVLVEHASQKALERARIEKPDACVLDIGLPDMNGNQLARRLRSEPETANALLIAVTGYGHEHDREISLAAGFNEYFVKPVDVDKLTALLDAAGATWRRSH